MNTTPIEIEIFRAGTQTASNGSTFTFSIGDLKQVVDTFNPKQFRPPLIVSHDTKGKSDRSLANSELCYGIPSYLKLVGNTLKAGFDKIAPQMVDWVKNGMLHSVSSSFYLPNSPNNPYPGKLSLRHVAALGATPPAVKGLMPLEFNVFENEDGVIEFNMKSAWGVCADLFQQFRDYLIEKESLEVANNVLPSDQISQLRDMGDSEGMLLAQIQSLKMRVSELEDEESSEDMDYMEDEDTEYMDMDYKKLMADAGMSTADVAKKVGCSEEDVKMFTSGEKNPTPMQMNKLKKILMPAPAEMQELLEREAALLQREAEFEEREITAFVDGIIREGKLTSGKRDRTIATLKAASGDVEFGEESQSLRQTLMDDLSSRSAWNYSEEIVTPLTTSAASPNFSAPSGYGVDKQSGDMYRRAIAFCQSNNLDANNSEHWEQALEGVMNNA